MALASLQLTCDAQHRGFQINKALVNSVVIGVDNTDDLDFGLLRSPRHVKESVYELPIRIGRLQLAR